MDSLIPKSRVQAKKLGSLFYKTDKPCISGNIELRKINGQCICVDCVERVKQINKKLRKENFVKYKSKRQKWLLENKEKVSEKQKKWVENNIDRYKKYNKTWREMNKPKIQKHRHSRRINKIRNKNLKTNNFDKFVLEEASDLSSKRKKIFGYDWHIDHLIPLQAKNACGLHCAYNIQVIPKILNLKKRNKMMFTEPLEWLNG